MLQQTFIHLPGIGAETERALWRAGCLTWTDLLANFEQHSVGSADRSLVKLALQGSIQALERREGWHFAGPLGLKEAWRAYPEFKHEAVFLDIETDGGSAGRSVTTIGMWSDERFVGLVKDRDMDQFPDIIGQYKMIVTFFGAGFDLPMLKKRFPTITFDQIHLDLCPTLKKLGFKGGLKKIERDLGISRADEVDGMSGVDAIRLWQRYRHFTMGRANS